MKHSFINRLFGLFFACFIAIPGLYAAVTFKTKPYLQHLQASEVTIMWMTEGVGHGWVEWGVSSSSLANKNEQNDRGLIQAYTDINRITIEGLTPNTTYYYRVCFREITATANTSATFGSTITSATYSFKTPPANDNNVTMLVLNDARNDATIIGHFAKHAKTPAYDLVFFNGDMLSAVPNKAAVMDNLIIPAADQFATSIPFYTVRGENELKNRYAQNYLSCFYPGEKNKGYYSFSRGPVFFIALDSGNNEDDDMNNYSQLSASAKYREEQAVWLKEQLQSEQRANASYTVVMMHLPTHSNTGADEFGVVACREAFSSLFNEYGIDLLISGHTRKAGVLPATASRLYPIVAGGGYGKSATKTDTNAACVILTADLSQLKVTLLDYSGTETAVPVINAN